MLRSVLLFAVLLLLSSSIAQDSPKPAGRVLGIGGIFFKSAQQKEVSAWYERHLGFKREPWGGTLFAWRHPAAPTDHHVTVWNIFSSKTDYFQPSQASFMINYVVDDLDAVLKRLEAEKVKIDPKREQDEGGRFAWIYDPDGNKIELWEPSKKRLAGQ